MGPSLISRDFSDMARPDPLPGDGRDPPDLVGALPLPASSATDDPGTPPVPPRDTRLYSTFFIRPRMVGEMDPFHDRSISFLLFPLALRSSPMMHPIIRAGI
jgi:hypothetical protein